MKRVLTTVLLLTGCAAAPPPTAPAGARLDAPQPSAPVAASVRVAAVASSASQAAGNESFGVEASGVETAFGNISVKKENQRVVCKYEKPTGSHFPKRVCRTVTAGESSRAAPVGVRTVRGVVPAPR